MTGKLRPQTIDAGSPPDISVVIPLYDEEENIPLLIERLRAALSQIDLHHEIILVDDGSRDMTWPTIRKLAAEDHRIKGISLSRNFGHQQALLAGLRHASGRAVISMDGDLQHPPETLNEMIQAWRSGYKVVNTARIDSNDTSLFKRLTSRWFYAMFSWLSGLDMQRGASDFRLLDHQVLEAIGDIQAPDMFLRGLVNWVGFPAATIDYRAEPRFAGKTKYTFVKMLRFSTSAIVSFSSIPLKIGIWLGLGTSGFAFLLIVYILVQYFRGITVPGWASILTATSFMFGILFILLGIIGTYLGSIHELLKNRPRFVVNETIGLVQTREETAPANEEAHL